MKRIVGLTVLLVALVVTRASADTLAFPYSVVSTSFTAGGSSQAFSPGTAQAHALATWGVVFSGSLAATDWVYVYSITNTSAAPLTDAIVNLSVDLGSTVDSTGSSAGTTFLPVLAGGTPETLNFDGITLVGNSGAGILPGQTAVVAFASPGAPAAFSGSLQDHSAGDALPFLISAAGTNGGGTPLPVPASVFGGLGLLGLLLGSSAKMLRAQQI